MKKIYSFALLSVFALSVSAQDAYEAASLATTDLNGTARYVGMGGALSALGGDISVMGTNPAGIGIYRRSEVTTTFSGLFTGVNALGQDKSRISWDNLGAVFAIDVDDSGEGLQFVNVGINYMKKRNFLSNLNTGIDGLYLGGQPAYSQTFQIAGNANDCLDYDDWTGLLPDVSASSDGKSVHDGFLSEGYVTDKDGNFVLDKDGNKILVYDGVAAKYADYSRATHGNNSETDINLSFNVSDRYFFGVTMGLYSLDYTRESQYYEYGMDDQSYRINSWYRIEGDGVDFKFGFICRPIEDSPLRLGVSLHTPTWFRLTDANGVSVNYNGMSSFSRDADTYEYDYRTPWKLNLSLGYTIGNQVAIGAEYEYTDFSSAKYSSLDRGDDNYIRYINSYIQDGFKAQHMFKIGAEYKPTKDFSIRLGYNYLSSPYHDDSFRSITYFSNYTETDWTNWKAINRFTAGIGYRFGNCFFDMAFQRQLQNGDFYAFDDNVDGRYLPATKIKNNRSQLMATFGIKF